MKTAARGWMRRAAAAALVFVLLFCGAPPVLAEDTLPTNIYKITTHPTAEGKEGDKLIDYTISGGAVGVSIDGGGTYTDVPGKFLWADPYRQTPTKTSRTFVADFFKTGETTVTISTPIEVTVNSTAPMTADQINAAALTATTADIDELRAALAACTNKNRIYDSTIRRMGEVYYQAHGFDETVDVNSGSASSNRMPNDAWSYGAAMAAGGAAFVRVYQERPSSGAVLQFDIELNGSTRLATPVTLKLGLPGGWNNSRDYYLRGSGSSPSVSIARNGGDRYYMTFTTDTLGTFKLYRDSDHPNHDDDDDYDVPSFWLDVIDEIADAGRDDYIRVNAGTRSTVPAEVLRELRGRSVTLALRRTNRPTITIYGRDIITVPSSLDHYTMTSLANRYGTAGGASSERETAPASKPPAPPPVYVAPPPVYVAPPPVYVAPNPPPVSSAPPESSSSEIAAIESEREILAEEDPPLSEPASELPSKPQEPTGGEPADPLNFGLFVILVLSLAAVASVGITIVVWNKRN